MIYGITISYFRVLLLSLGLVQFFCLSCSLRKCFMEWLSLSSTRWCRSSMSSLFIMPLCTAAVLMAALSWGRTNGSFRFFFDFSSFSLSSRYSSPSIIPCGYLHTAPTYVACLVAHHKIYTNFYLLMNLRFVNPQN